MQAKAAAIVCLLLVVSGCALKTPGEPECISGVTNFQQLRELKPSMEFERLGQIFIQGGTTTVTADGALRAVQGPNGEWIVDGLDPESVFITIKPANNKEEGYRYSVLSNAGTRDLYLQNEKCFSIVKSMHPVAYKEAVTITVYGA